ncbi:hypothetical protein CSAL01_00100 [Colletotrichum salicis]|uniref:Nephrocystin 3-like N-terminal domain-containing protein n=1 Tax=Colletotrichum salicis TaxID=1209931 RepID=A0A135V892_9PEZI|nr:hypothetical protein CSAL01_00100 [Colletotrichum salicis]
MEFTAAISLAGNLLQFCELGAKLVRGTLERYKSVDGSAIHVEILIADARSLRHLADDILHNESDAVKTTESSMLRSIAQRCTEDAVVLIEILDALKVDTNPGQSLYTRKLQSFGQALRRMLKEHKVRELELRLGDLRRELHMFLTHASGTAQKEIHSLFRKLEDQNNNLEAKSTARLDDIVGRIDKTTQVLRKAAPKGFSEQISLLRAEIDDFSEEQQYVRTRHQILRSLKFDQIKTRQEAIKERHKAIFDWVFSQDDTLFPQWLESGKGIFWIRGKPGSGKSTLMKFLVTHPTMRLKLEAWGEGCTTVIACHNFWNAGISIQKSQRGLLQTLLYEVLREVPNLIDRVCSRLRSALQHELMETWGKEELLAVFGLLDSQTDLPVRFCFFIDGLDEYTDRAKRYDNTFEDLLQILKDFASSPSLKICASRRPWDAFLAAFMDAFRAQPWQLRMEDLTRDDIRNYITDTLCNNNDFTALTKQDSRCSRVAETIVDRAQGVFLWIYLVVESLKNGLAKGDTFTELQRWVDELPADLEEYFQHIIESIEPVYWKSTSPFEFLEQEAESSSYALQMKVNSILPNDLAKLHDRMKKRLNARGKDLLYVTFHPAKNQFLQYQVDFLHQTGQKCPLDYFRDIPMGNFKEKRQNFLASSIQARLSLYAKHKINLDPDQVKKKSGRPLLDYALRPITVTPLQLPTQEDPVGAMVEFLLRNGADPNQRVELYGGKTPWQLFLSVCYGHGLQADKLNLEEDEVTDTMVVMLLSGADPNFKGDLQGGGKAHVLGVAQRLGLSRAKVERIKSVMKDGRNSQQSFTTPGEEPARASRLITLPAQRPSPAIPLHTAQFLQILLPSISLDSQLSPRVCPHLSEALSNHRFYQLSQPNTSTSKPPMTQHPSGPVLLSIDLEYRIEYPGKTDDQEPLDFAAGKAPILVNEGPFYAAPAIGDSGPPTAVRPAPNSPQLLSRHLTPAAPSTTPSAIPMASIIIRQDPGSLYRPGRGNIGYIIVSDKNNTGEPASRDDDDSWMEFLTDEAIADLTLPDAELESSPSSLDSSDTQSLGPQPNTPEEVLDSVEGTDMQNEMDEGNQMDEDGSYTAIQFRNGPLNPMLIDGVPREFTLESFRGFYDNTGNPVFRDDYTSNLPNHAPGLPDHLRQPIFVDWAEPFKSPIYALRYLAEIAGDYYTVALLNQRIKIQQGPQTPGAQSISQSYLVSPAISHIASPTPAPKRLRFSDDVARSG